MWMLVSCNAYVTVSNNREKFHYNQISDNNKLPYKNFVDV